MTRQEFREHPEYKKAVDKITNYPKGFKWTMKWYEIPKGKTNALRIVLKDCQKAGLIDCVSVGYGFVEDDFDITEEEYIRL